MLKKLETIKLDYNQIKKIPEILYFFILKMEDFIRVIQPLTGDSIYGKMYLKT